MGDRCALSKTTLYYGWLLPMSIIILHNLVVFGLVLRVLCQEQPGGIRFTNIFVHFPNLTIVCRRFAIKLTRFRPIFLCLFIYLFIYLYTYLLILK